MVHWISCHSMMNSSLTCHIVITKQTNCHIFHSFCSFYLNTATRSDQLGIVLVNQLHSMYHRYHSTASFISMSSTMITFVTQHVHCCYVVTSVFETWLGGVSRAFMTCWLWTFDLNIISVYCIKVHLMISVLSKQTHRYKLTPPLLSTKLYDLVWILIQPYLWWVCCVKRILTVYVLYRTIIMCRYVHSSSTKYTSATFIIALSPAWYRFLIALWI